MKKERSIAFLGIALVLSAASGAFSEEATATSGWVNRPRPQKTDKGKD